MADTLTKITRNYQVTIPPAARRALRLKVGDFVRATPRPDGVLLQPAKVVTRDTFEQELERRLAEGLADIKAGRVHGPFGTVAQLARSLRAKRKKVKPKQ